MGEERIEVEGQDLSDAIRQAMERLEAGSKREIQYEYDRAHFRTGADTVKIHAWKKEARQVNSIGFAVDYVSGFLDRFGVDEGRIDVVEEDEKAILSVTAGDYGNILIGRDGKNLEALQHLTAKALMHNGHEHRVVVDVEDYRSRRDHNLREDAQEACKRVLATGESVEFTALNSYERRIAHMEVAKVEGVRSTSVGVGKVKDLKILPE